MGKSRKPLAQPRLRIVPHFSSGIVEPAKRERACSRSRVSLALLSLRTSEGLLVVYAQPFSYNSALAYYARDLFV